MIDLKDLQFLVALARHRHFARAAGECGVSQPAFSMRIKALEEKLNTTIVKRGNRFQGLTGEGEAILRRARYILDEVRELEQEARAATGDVAGRVSIGVVPTAAVFAGHLATELHSAHPGIVATIETASSLAIQQGIELGRYDAGLTYSDGVSHDILQVEPLYDETYALLLTRELAAGRSEIGWREAAELPLSLLEPGMQNRRILDRAFDDAGAVPNVVAESSGHLAALAMVVSGRAATVVPEVLVSTLGQIAGLVALPLVEPSLAKSISLVAANRGPGRATIDALFRVARVISRD